MNTFCPDDRMTSLLGVVRDDEPNARRDLDALLLAYPDDPRLHLLKGSLLAAAQDYAAARQAMRRAVDLAPDYDVARFQLGFLLLTSGEPHAAQEAWGPLHGLPKDNYLRLFVEGLCHLIRDEFADTVRQLEDGIARNRDNVPMNRDMQLLVAEARRKLEAGDAAASPVDLLLQQSAFKATRH
jgi:tetratricopeptide (TPR) repeat protein